MFTILCIITAPLFAVMALLLGLQVRKQGAELHNLHSKYAGAVALARLERETTLSTEQRLEQARARRSQLEAQLDDQRAALELSLAELLKLDKDQPLPIDVSSLRQAVPGSDDDW